MVTGLSPLADKRRDECQDIKPSVWVRFPLEVLETNPLYKNTPKMKED